MTSISGVSGDPCTVFGQLKQKKKDKMDALFEKEEKAEEKCIFCLNYSGQKFCELGHRNQNVKKLASLIKFRFLLRLKKP